MVNLVVPSNLQLTKPNSPEKPWVATVGDSTPLRITPDLAKVLNWYKDGRNTSASDYFGAQIDQEQLEEAESILRKFNLLTDEASATVQKKPRLRFNSLFSIQFAVLNKPRHFAWLEALANRRVLVGGTFANAILAILGGALIGVYWASFFEAITTPQTVGTILVMFVFLIASVSLHEFAHAAALTYFGGTVRRMGVMLFYLSPAFFCDVTDAWRLERKNQRTLIALAGVIATFGIAGFATLIYVLTGREHDWLAVASLALYVGSVLNLVPFIKLDGYLALMTFLDRPNMRARSMDEWKQAALALFGGNWQRLRTFKPSMIMFGLAASATPVVILLMLAASLGNARAGIVGEALAFSVLLTAMVLVVRGIYRLATIRLAEGEAGLGARALSVAAATGVALAVTAVPLPQFEVGSYWEADGQLVTNLEVESGQTVTLHRDGILATKPLGTAVVGAETVTSEMPAQALAPNIKAEGFAGEVQARHLLQYEGLQAKEPGSVMLEKGSQPLGLWILNALTFGAFQGPQQVSLSSE
ncbi:MAG: zinc metalloprotease [Actinomycetaceae bacterium]|nr:zinc metalloprotease [Actinomycetaceae bacterium]